MDEPRVEDMRDSPRRKRAASPDSASKRRTQTPTASGSGSSSRDVSPPSPSPAQEAFFSATDASPSSSRSTDTMAMDYELPPRSYVPYAQGRNPYSINGGRYESNSEVHERLAGWSMNELGSLDPHTGPPPRWNPTAAPRRESMYAASSPQAVRDALFAARAERAERLSAERPYLSRYEPPRRRNPEVLDPASLFEAGPSSLAGASGPSSGSESGSSGLASSSSFEPNWDMTGVYTRRTGPPPAPSTGSNARSNLAAAQARLRAERLAAFERRIYAEPPPPASEVAARSRLPPNTLGHTSHGHAHGSHYNPAATPFGSALERGYYAYAHARGDPYTLIAVPPEFARYAFSRRRLPARLDGLSDEEKRQAARDALDAVSRLATEERRRLAEKVLQKVVYSELCAHVNAPSAAATSTSEPETVSGGMMDNLELPAAPAKTITWDAEVETACAICQDDYDAQDESVLTPCGHMYHSSCLGTWLARSNPAASTCPMCRRDLACLAVLRRMSDEGEAKRLWVSVGDEGERGGWI